MTYEKNVTLFRMKNKLRHIDMKYLYLVTSHD